MIILLHVAIALLSILSTTLGYIRPSTINLKVSYVLVALTFVTGFYLVVAEPAQMVRTCLSGITYLALVSLGILLTRRKMATLQSENN